MILINKAGLLLYKYSKNNSPRKSTYYPQVEAITLVKKDTETGRYFALKVHQLVEKG